MTRHQQRQLSVARTFLQSLAEKLDSPISVRLWDGSEVPLGRSVRSNLAVSISGPGVIGSLMRRPTPDNLLRHYARGQVDFHGTDLYTFIDTARVRNSRKKSRSISKSVLAKAIASFLFAPAESTEVDHCYAGDEIGHKRAEGENKDFIQFHYDISNEFYKLFLDKEMV
ncbi:MAG: class I SAM-dependent methyltransferase, partial [Planctomycetaceae bacterium]|nr:class I SAM-dependent methyltransferase [Planctomycetaceae bacterium]